MDLHGGNIYKLSREGRKNLLDYSSNINPLGVPQKFREEVIKNFDILEKYPDPDYIELRENIGKYNTISPKNIVVGNGATEILFLYMKSLQPKKALVIAPSFAEYRRALESIDCEIDYYILTEEEEYTLNCNKFLAYIKNTNTSYDLVVLCNPNNPTGKFIPLKDIEKINNELKKRGIKLFIDEAFIEFIRGWKKLSAINLKDSNIFIMKALTKFFAVPGLRLGYGISYDENIFQNMKKYKEPWSVNSFAEIAGKTMLWDNEYIKKSEEWIDIEKLWFYEKLSQIRGIETYKTETNFILIKVLNFSACEIREKMIDRGILIRDASNFVGLDKNYIRLAIKDRENNIKVIKTLQEVIE